MTNAERQARHREAMRKKGFVQALLWIRPDKKSHLKQFAEFLNSRKSGDQNV